MPTGALFAQNLGVSAAPANVLQLSASATVEVRQDLLTLNLTTTREGSDANAVQAQVRQALDAALTTAKAAAQPQQMDVRTGHFSLSPRWGREGKITGWVGSAELVLEGRDFARITQTAGRIQSMTIANVGFGLSREQRERSEAEAQGQAIERFRARATELSRQFGFAGYTLREVSVGASEPGFGPRPLLMAAGVRSTDAAPVPVEAGKSNVTVNVSGSVQLR